MRYLRRQRRAGSWRSDLGRVLFFGVFRRFRVVRRLAIEVQMSSGPRPPRRPSDFLTAAMTRQLRLGSKRNKITIDRGLQVPMADGVILLADHYAPVNTGPRPTVLMRTPYGRGWQMAMMARPFAERGYHVLLQSCRGTFGSGGTFTPAVDEAADGQDTVAWLRTQDWFSGRLALVGPSYLAFAAWALVLDPPPELTALALHVSPHDLAAAGFGRGPFELFNLLLWTDLMAHQERHGSAQMMWRTMTADKRLAAALNRLPIASTGTTIGGDAVPWYADWLAHPESADRYWAGYSATAALDRVTVPTLLVTGTHDFFVEQTLQQYQALRQRGVTTALTMGPWTHMNIDMGVAIREALAWLDAYADGNGADSSPRRSPVRAWVSGAQVWRGLPHWPPAGTVPTTLHLVGGGRLTATPPDGNGDATVFTYDPADPTPSVGGRLMSIRTGGGQDNSELERRADVLAFSTEPLESAVEIAGVPVVRLHLRSDNANFDMFARLCDVSPDGRSENLTDQVFRSSPADVTPGEAGYVELPLTDLSHVFRPGHRIRVQLSGGAHPRFSRNLGTDADPVHGTRTAPVTHHVHHTQLYPSALVLPVLPAALPPSQLNGHAVGKLAAADAQSVSTPSPQPAPPAS
jgi:putative CocE/NonD family hydrolase